MCYVTIGNNIYTASHILEFLNTYICPLKKFDDAYEFCVF